MLSPGFSFQRTLWCAMWLFCLVVAYARATDAANPTGTLPEDYLPGLKPILQQAMKQSPQMLLQQIEVLRSEARVLQSDAERWPQLGGNIRYDSNRTAATSSVPSVDSGLFYSISANQAVFHWGAIKHRGEIARIEVAIAEKNYTEAYRTLAVQLRQLYVQLIARHAQLRSEQFGLSLRQRELATAKERLAIGSSSPAEIAGRELDINEGQLTIDRYQTEFDADRRRLSRLAGLTPDIPEQEIPYEIPFPQYDSSASAQMLAGFLREGWKSNFAAQVAELHVKEADLNYRIARVRLLPKFNASVGHSRESSTSATATQVSQTAITRDTIELRGDWSIFDGFATKGVKREALADKHSWERRREIDADAVMDDAQRLVRVVDIDARAMKYAEQRRAGAAALVKLAEEDLQKSGTASQATVNSATRDLYNAEYNAALSRANFLSDWSTFQSIVGDDPVLMNLPSRYVRAKR